jgi:hypothetical protein
MSGGERQMITAPSLGDKIIQAFMILTSEVMYTAQNDTMSFFSRPRKSPGKVPNSHKNRQQESMGAVAAIFSILCQFCQKKKT